MIKGNDMCDLNRVAGFLIAAKVAYLAVLIALGVGIANSASFFAAAANVPLMVGVILGTGLATGMYTAALIELDQCAAGTCGAEFAALRQNVANLLTALAVFTAALVALAVVAAIPFAGAATIVGFLVGFASLTVIVTGILEFGFGPAVQNYNRCRAAAAMTTLLEAVLFFSYTNGVASLIFAAAVWLPGLAR